MPPLKYFVPNGFTALSLLLGLASIVMSVEGNFELAAWMILWGTLLDKLDGSAARLFHATSEFGVQFDSFADFVAFGIAPAALVYFRLVGTSLYEGSFRMALVASAGLYVVALAVRLSRFNITTAAGETMFTGIPGTLMGAVLAAGYLSFIHQGLDDSLLAYSPAALAIGAALMVSNLKLPKLKVRKNQALNVFQLGNVLAAYILGPLRLFPEYLFGLACSYLVVGVVVGMVMPPAKEPDEGERQTQPA